MISLKSKMHVYSSVNAYTVTCMLNININYKIKRVPNKRKGYGNIDLISISFLDRAWYFKFFDLTNSVKLDKKLVASCSLSSMISIKF